MNNYNATLSDSLGQPWWRVRPQLVLTLVPLTALCAAIWVEGPVRSWMTHKLVTVEMPEVVLFADTRG
jgi:hypothetical protein